ncbi:MAG: YlqD family protein [Armatimonadota bacterium]
METLRLRQDIGLIFIVTEDLKTRLTEEVKAAVDDVQSQIDQFDFRARHALAELQRTDLNRAMAARQQIDAEKRRIEAVKRELEDRQKEIDALTVGSEYPRGSIEGMVDVAMGDNLFEKLAGYQVVVKDGAVVEIRKQKLSATDVILPQQQVLRPGQQ